MSDSYIFFSLSLSLSRFVVSKEQSFTRPITLLRAFAALFNFDVSYHWQSVERRDWAERACADL
jgi:hypothetical protein